MFLKEVHMDLNHWSFRLLHFTFPGMHRFNNFCPHFWLTILSILILPFTIILKSLVRLGRILVAPLEAIATKIDAVHEERMETAFEKLPYREQLLGALLYYNDHAAMYNIPKCEINRLRKYKKKFSLYHKRDQFGKNFQWRPYHRDENHLPFTAVEKEALAILESLRVEEETKPYVAPISIKDTFVSVKEKKGNSIAVLMWIAKYIAAPLLGIFIAFGLVSVLYYIALGLGWVWYWIVYYFSNTFNFSTFLIVIAVVVVIVGIVLLGVWLVSKLVEFLQSRTFPLFECQARRDFLRKLFTPVAFIIAGIVSIVSFLWLGLKTFKSKNCPAIIWEEKKK
jgi:hypothetical protein